MLRTRLNNKFAQIRSLAVGLLGLLLTVVLSSSSAFAASDQITVTTDRTDLTPGQEVTVNLSLPDDLKVYALTATLQYDENIFEQLATSDFDTPDTTYISYNPTNQEFGLVNQSGAIEQNLFTVHLRVKDNPGVGETNIALTNISTSDGSGQTKLPPTIATVNVTKDAADGEVIPVASSTNESQFTEADSEQAENVFFTTPFIIAAVIMLIIIVLVAVLYFSHLDPHVSKLFYTLIGLGVAILIVVVALINVNNGKKDVNDDGQVNYDDAMAIIDYLISAKGNQDEQTDSSAAGSGANSSTYQTFGGSSSGGSSASGSSQSSSQNSGQTPNQPSDQAPLPDQNPNTGETTPPPDRFDTDNNGHVDVGDAGHNAEQVEQETTVALSTTDEQPAYVDKNTDTLKFAAKVEPEGVYLSTVKINGELHNVEHSNGIYTAKISPLATAGKQNFTISDPITTNGKTFRQSLAVNLEVLKDIPTLIDFDLDESAKTISFALNDEDEAFISGTAEIFHIQDFGTPLTSAAIVPEGTTLQPHDLEEEQHYQLQITGAYCRVEDRDNADYCHDNQSFYTHDFEFLHDYRLIVDGYNVTDYVEPNQRPTLTFHSSNAHNLPVYEATVTVAGQTHTYPVVQSSPDNYEIYLDHAANAPGKYDVSLDKITLGNLQTFDNTHDYNVDALSYFVPKNAPVVSALALTANPDQKQIAARFKLDDAADIVSKLTLVLSDTSGKIIDQTAINAERFRGKHSVNLDATLKYDADTFDRLLKVQVLADYDLGDQYTFTQKPLAESEISIIDETKHYIESLYTRDVRNNNSPVTTRYAEKGQKRFELDIEVYLADGYRTRSYGATSAYTVNSLNYPAQSGPNGHHAVFVGIPDRAGVLNLEVSRVQYAQNGANSQYSDWYSLPKRSYEIEVLKDAPKIENLSMAEDYAARTVTFNFDVAVDATATEDDESFIDGSLNYGAKSESIHRGHNSVTFSDIDTGKTADLVFRASYDRDTDQLNHYNENRDDNQVENGIIYQTKYALLDDEAYRDVHLGNIKLVSLDRNEITPVFKKNEDVSIDFDLVGLPAAIEAEPAKLIVEKGRESLRYDLIIYEDGYGLVLPGFYDAGPRAYIVTGIVLDNGREIRFQTAEQISLEVLRDVPTIENFEYEESDSTITVRSKLKDLDKAIINGAHVRVHKESGEEVYSGDYEEEFEFSKSGESSRYYVTVTGAYTLAGKGTTADNPYYRDSAELLSAIISLEENHIELKHINDINLYQITNNGAILINETSQSELEQHPEQYFVEIAMDDLPTFRAALEFAAEENGQLYLYLEPTATFLENTPKSDHLKIKYGEVDEHGRAKNEFHPDTAFQKLLEKLNRGDNVTLDRDYDASVLSVDQQFYVNNYGGTLNGNGHIIRNLQKPLFNTIDGGTIKNLVLENVSLTSSHRGSLANQTSQATIENVIVYDVSTEGNAGRLGGLVGTASQTTIKSSAVNGFKFSMAWSVQQTGGLVGILGSNSTIENSYAIGSIAANWNFFGGLVGDTEGAPTIKNSYAKVDLSGANISCGLGCSYTHGLSISHSISLSRSSNANYSPVSNKTNALNGNFYLDTGSSADKSEQGTRISSESEVTAALFQKAQFSEKIWRLDSSVSYANPPRLTVEKTVSSSIETADNYDPKNATIYSNLAALAPFYSTEKVVEAGNAIAGRDIPTTTKRIKHLIPLDTNGSLVTYLTTADLGKLTQLRLVFDDDSVATYPVYYDKTYDTVASYRIKDLELDYNYPHYIIDASSQVVNHLVNYLNSLDYTANLDQLTKADDARVVRDFYNDTTKNELREFVLKYLSNSNYASTSTHQVINNHIERQAKSSQKLVRALYVYNFLRRFYDLDFNGLKFYDAVLFDLQGFNRTLTTDGVVDTFLSKDTNFKTEWGSGTNATYVSMFSSKTGLANIPAFIEYVAKHFSNVTDMNAWVHTQFKGFLAERSVDNQPDYSSDGNVPTNAGSAYQNTGVLYTLWDHFTHVDSLRSEATYRVYDFVLPILTMPKNSTYIISTPVQFIIGSQRTYMADPAAPDAAKNFNFRVNAYANRMKTYYTTAYGLIGDASIINKLQLFTLDKNMAYGDDGVNTRQYRGSTADPHHKNFNEVIGRFPANSGINAGANSEHVEFDVAGVMDANIKEVADYLQIPVSESTFGTWSHETAHMIDARLWLKNNGRRWDAGGEDYADGNLRQEFDRNLIVMNLTRELGDDCEVASPCSPSRIDTPAEIKDFYGKAFDAIYAMDYIEALAFLQLSPDDKAQIGAQISYPKEQENLNNDATKHLAYKTTQYAWLSAEEWEELSLNSIDDLYDNKIMIYPGLYKKSTRADNSYGGEGISTVHWYQPHNNYGRPDSYSLKWLAYEMLGYAGYDDGYIKYYSNIDPQTYTYTDASGKQQTIASYKTDQVLEEIVGTDFDTYKKDRFHAVEAKLTNLNAAVDVEAYAKKFYEALKADAQYQQEEIAKKFTTPEGEKACLEYYWCTHTYGSDIGLFDIVGKPHSSQVRYDFFQALKRSTQDFTTGEIFSATKQQQGFNNIDELNQSLRSYKATLDQASVEPAADA